MSAQPELTIVVPFYNEEQVLPLLKQQLASTPGIPESHEFIFVSDGSTDDSVSVIEEWARHDLTVKLIVLSRNFGQQAAISAGIDHCDGRYVGIMDADLQDSPEELLEMYNTAKNQNLDVVYSIRGQRKESLQKRTAYRLFYALYAYISDTPVDSGGGDFCVLSRRAVDTLKSMPERIRFVRGLRAWVGLRQRGILTLTRPARAAGVPKYSFAKLTALAINGLTAFSIKPLRIATLLGILFSGISLSGAFIYLLLFFVKDLHASVPGFTSIVLLILLLNGLQFLMIGIMGEYIGRIYWEVKGRPTYLVDRVVNLPVKNQ
jgi:glycosyltransferase involved in cell wall biosynthesis